MRSRNVLQSSGPRRRMAISVAEDENLQRPADRNGADDADREEPPLHAREARRPRAAAHRAGRQSGGAGDRAGEKERAERKQPHRVREVALPHVRIGTSPAAERTGVSGQVVERTWRRAEVCCLEQEVHARVHEPEHEGSEQREVAQSLSGHGPVQGDRQRHHLSRPTMSSVVSATATPALRNASSLLLAVPRLPEMMAPAWPMRLPSGAVRPEMKATVLSRLPRPSSSAACSSSLPPISPITTRCVVEGSFSKSSTTSRKVSPSTGSPPIPTMVDWPMPDADSADATS